MSDQDRPPVTLSNTFRVGRSTVEMTFSDGRLATIWSPYMPKPSSLSREEMKQYRAGRDALIAEIAKMIGVNVLTIEI
jgi:hypothetical protein